MSSDNTTINNNDCETETDKNEVVYRALARQLEYYFSSQNLAVDTYLQTLRELNDGCVPISIIANFSKVKSIASQLTPQTSATASTSRSSSRSSGCESISSNSSKCTIGNESQNSASTSHHDTAPSSSDVPSLVIGNHVSSSSSSSPSVTPRLFPSTELQFRIDAIVRVIQPAYTDQLQIYDIDSRTGKITDPHNNDNNSSSSSATTSTILAIGFKAGCQPKDCGVVVKENEISTQTTTTDHNMASSSSIALDETNTLILRDVDPNVSECEVRSILEAIDDCPTVINLVPDIAACWFITFATTDRYDLIRVMMQLRTMTYPSNGDPVMVRLRASVVPSQSTIIRVDSYDYHRHSVSSAMTNLIDPTVAPKKKRRKKKRAKNKKNKTSTTSVATTTSLSTGRSDTSVSDTATSNKEPEPLDLTHDDFPTLLRHNDNVEWSSSSIDMLNGSIHDDIEDEVSHESSTNKEGEQFEEEEEEVEGNGLAVKFTNKLGLNHSDTASTATTTSSNASSGSDTFKSKHYRGESCNTGTESPIVLSGYAAAVRRVVAPPSSSVEPINHYHCSTLAPTGGLIESVESVERIEVEVTLAGKETNGCGSEFSSLPPHAPHEAEDHQLPVEESSFVTEKPALDHAIPLPKIKWGNRPSFVDVIRESSGSSSGSHTGSMKQ